MAKQWFFVRKKGDEYIVYKRINLYGKDTVDNIRPFSSHSSREEAMELCKVCNSRMENL